MERSVWPQGATVTGRQRGYWDRRYPSGGSPEHRRNRAAAEAAAAAAAAAVAHGLEVLVFACSDEECPSCNPPSEPKAAA